jgi:hypothetical protein
MKYADEIAAMIDYKVSTYQIRLLEAEDVLRELKSEKKLPVQKKLWELMHDNYHLFPIKKPDKLKFISKFY